MKRTLLIVLILLSVFLLAVECGDGDGGSPDTDDPESVCDYLMNKCETLYDTRQLCIDDVKTMDECRLECAVDISDCESIDQCLWWGLGNKGEADDYCDDGAGSGDSDVDSDADTDETFEECSERACPTQNAACGANADCVSIFEVCYPQCASDMDCIALCALDYADGIEDHDALFSCLQLNCS